MKKFNENFKLVYYGEPRYEINYENKTVKCHLTVKIITPDSLYANKIMDTTLMSANGYAKCDNMDKFDVETGKRIALTRAESLAYHKAMVLIRKCTDDMLRIFEAAERFENKSKYVQKHNEHYIKANYGPRDEKCVKKNVCTQPRDEKGRFLPKTEPVNDCCKKSNGISIKINKKYSK